MYQLIIRSHYLKLFLREGNIISRIEIREREREAGGGGGEVGAEAAFAVTERPLCLPEEQSILLQMAWADPAHERKKKRHRTADRRSSSWSEKHRALVRARESQPGRISSREKTNSLCYFVLSSLSCPP